MRILVERQKTKGKVSGGEDAGGNRKDATLLIEVLIATDDTAGV